MIAVDSSVSHITPPSFISHNGSKQVYAITIQSHVGTYWLRGLPMTTCSVVAAAADVVVVELAGLALAAELDFLVVASQLAGHDLHGACTR
jgi:hypothetical protein